MSLSVLTTADEDAWRRALPASRSAFGSFEFARVQERTGAGRSLLVVAGPDERRLAYPLLLRAVPFHLAGDNKLNDSATPPFTGPIPLAADGEEGPGSAVEITEALAGLSVVAEFAHLHPWRARSAPIGGAEPNREIVWVDLTLDEERIWTDSYSQARRNQVRQAMREGVTVRAATDLDDIAEFHRIYSQTMERNNALDSYRFPRSYFEAFFEEMPANARFALAEHEGRVIAAGLYVHDREDAYYYLGGADHAHQRLRPTNAVIHETIRWARDSGKRRLILGGGYEADDGIFRFKASFSPLRATLELARRVHLPDEYEALLRAWRAHHGADADPGTYFPAYRAAPA